MEISTTTINFSDLMTKDRLILFFQINTIPSRLLTFLFHIDIDTNTVSSLRSQRFQFIIEIIVLLNNTRSPAHDCTLLLFSDNQKNTGLGDKVWTDHMQY